MRRTLALLAALACGCYSVSPTPCKITCVPPSGSCPSGEVCKSDGFCHADENEPACEPVDALPPPTVDAAPGPGIDAAN